MKKHIKFISIILIIVLITVTYGIISNPQRRIKNFVSKNYLELGNIADQYLNGEISTKTYKGIKIEQVFTGTNNIVQFYYSGSGLAPASVYYGFYYSPNDIPVAYQNMEYTLSGISANEWEWSGEGDNGGRTVRIMVNWYYYEAWF